MTICQGNIELIRAAADNVTPQGKLLRHCPFIQRELLARGFLKPEDLDAQSLGKLLDEEFKTKWIDGQELMLTLHISPRKLQSLRSEGILPYSKINQKIYYKKEDIEKLLLDNYSINERNSIKASYSSQN